MSILWWVTIVALAALVAVWVGYPLVMWLASLIFRRPIRPDAIRGATRDVTVILATREPIGPIESRVRNVLDTDHPAHLIQVVVALDASRADADIAQVERIDPRVRAIIGDEPGGKAATLNAGVRAASTDLLVMADSAQRFDRMTIPVLAAAMEDTRFGAVSGALRLPRSGPVTWPIRLYWRLEKALRNFEALVHSSIGVTGAVYAVRRSLWPIIPPVVLLDDVHVPLSIVVAGHRVGFCYDSVATESRVLSAQEERVRKVRTLTGVLQLSAFIPGLLSFRRNPVLFQLVGHKYARLTSPFFLIVAIGAGSITVVEALMQQEFRTIAVLLVLALGVMLISTLRRMTISMMRWLFEMQIATAQAVGNALRGRWDVWDR